MTEQAVHAEERVAIFGGSFNPPHMGHVLAVVYVLATAPIDRVVVVPVFRHPFAKGLAPYEDRLAMCELAFSWIPHADVSTIERELGGESLTLRTLEKLTAMHPAWKMRLVIGTDVLPEVDKWHRFDLIEKLAPPLIVPRTGAGADPDRMVLPEVSSTRVRELLAREGDSELSAMIPSKVLAYARQKRLYVVGGTRAPRPRTAVEMARDRVVIVGAGKVGRSLHRAAVAVGVDVTLLHARSFARRASALGEGAPNVVVLAVSDGAIAETGDAVARAIEKRRGATAIVHTSGRFGPEALAGARGDSVSIGQMHPLVSFVDRSFAEVEGATMLLSGDAHAVRAARRFAVALRMIPRRFDALPRPLYHASAALVANSAAALAEAACELLASAGVPKKVAAAMVGPLLESVGRNVRGVGLPEALSGPVRRGDAAAVAGHLDALQRAAKKRKNLEWIVDLYRAGVLAQIPLARSLGEAPKSGLAEIQSRVAHAEKKAFRSALPSRKR